MGDSHIWAMGHSLSAVLYTTARNKMKNMEYAKKKKKERERERKKDEVNLTNLLKVPGHLCGRAVS